MAELTESKSAGTTDANRVGVLVVDDSPANLLSYRAILEDPTYDLVEARSGNEAVALAKAREFAIILLDMRMPDLSGFNTAKLIRADERSRHTPIMFLTAADIEQSELEEGYNLGAVDVFIKPFSSVVIRAKVREFVHLFEEKQRAHRQAAQLRMLVEGTSDYAIFLLDPLGNVASWNAGAERIKQYTASEIIGQHFSKFYPKEAIDRGWPTHELEVAKTEGRFEDEGWRIRKDGTQFWANVVITAVFDEAGLLQGFTKITRDMTERKKAEENARKLIEESTARRVVEENARVIQEHRERLHVTLSSIGDAVISTDASGRIEFLNPIAEQLVGWKSREVTGRSLGEIFCIVNETSRLPVENPALRALRDGRIVGLANHTILISRDGVERPIDDSAAPILDSNGTIVGSVLVFRDISERKRNEEALNERMQFLALNASVGEALVQGSELDAMLHRCADALVKNLDAAFARIWTLNPHDDVLELRASAGLYTHLNGFHSRIPLGQYKIGLIAQERKPHLTNSVVGDPRVSDQEWAKQEGMVAFAGYPLVVEDRLVGVMAMFARKPLSNATLEAMASIADEVALGIERKSAEQRLQEQQEWLRVTLASIGDAVIATDTQGRITFLNPVAEELTGWTEAEARQQPLENVFVILNELTRERVENPVSTVLRDGLIVGLGNHTVLIAKDGTARPIDDSAAPIRDDMGRMLGVVLIFRDVTEHRRAETELRESEQELADFFENATVGLHWVGPDGIIIRANQAELDMLGYTREEYVGRPIADFHADQEVICDILKRLKDGQRLGDYPARLRCQDGSIKDVLIDSSVMWKQGEFIHTRCFTRDITDTLRAEHELRQSEERFRTLFESMDEGFCVVEMLYDDEGRPVDYLFLEANPAFEKHTGFKGAVGRTIRELVPDHDAHWFEIYGRVVATGTPDRFVNEAKAMGRWYDVYAYRVGGEDSRKVGLLFTDVTSRKRAEDNLRQMASDLSEADRRKDEFLATLAHELRNPLAPIRNSLQILKMPKVDAETVERSREMMERQVHHLVRLVDDLLDVSRVMKGKIELRREPVELASIVARAIEIVQPLLNIQGHDLNVRLPSESLPLNADPVRLAQVISNLLTNAGKYTDPGGHIRLSAEVEGDQVAVRIRDDGIGISPDMLPHVFELFVQVDQSSAKAQGGLGIGLTLVKNLVEMHNGTVEAHSDGLGKGCEFIVRFPLMARSKRGHGDQTATHTEPAIPSGHKLLVVDDNPDAAISLSMLLRLQGHEVRMAHDGPSALEAAMQYLPDMIFLDIGMPGMDGYEVARRVRSIPCLERTILAALTGWGQQEDRRRTAEAGFDHHLVKPVEPQIVESLLRELNSARRST